MKTPVLINSNQFQCSRDGTLIDKNWVCNRLPDCPGGEDEQNCSEFQCTSGQRIAFQWSCDSHPDCDDSSDEHPAICPENQQTMEH